MNSQQAKNIAIETYLACQGIAPEREQGNYLWYHSPFRSERTPSFRVNRAFNSWFDYGLGKGGNILDLAMEMLQTDDLSRCLAHLESLEVVPFSFAQQKREVAQPESKIAINNVLPLTNPALLEYLSERGVNIDIAKTHCREVHYSAGGRGYFAVGFGNDAGGWVLRTKYFKGCSSPQSITTANKCSDTCLVFEGFMDMLSYLTLKNVPTPSLNIVVLNSVVNLNKAVDFLQRHDTIHCFLDNDEAGKRATAEIEKLGKNVVDQSSFYRDFEDLNDYLVSQKLKQTQTPTLKPRLRPKMR